MVAETIGHCQICANIVSTFFTKGVEISRSPLSSSFESAESKKSSKKGWLGLGAVAFFGLASAGSVFAASVSINSGDADISFTQGSKVIVACDTDGIGASVDAGFDGTSFGLGGITLTDVDEDCSDKAFTINLYDGTTKMLTVTGTLGSSLDGSTVSVSATGSDGDSGDVFIEVETSVEVVSTTNAWTNVAGPVVVAFENGDDAISMAADADDLVIEIG